MTAAVSSTRSPLAFFVLALALAAPFLVLGTLVKGPSGIPMDLPWSALAVVGPITAALILVNRKEGTSGIRQLLKRPFEYRRIKPIWYVPIILFMPAIVALSYVVMSLLEVPPKGSYTSFLAIPVLLVAFFIGAFCEEVGWTGYAIDPLQARWGALTGATVVGLVWAIIHLIPWIEVHGVTWTIGYSVWTIAARIVMVWLYNNTANSVLSAVLFHDMINTSGSLSPYIGSPLSPYIWAALTIATVALVTFLWGSKTLARYRYANKLAP